MSVEPEAPPASEDAALVEALLAGRYRILRKLGEGGMGSVYLGEHVLMGRQDAIKVLLPSLAGDPDAQARFKRGAQNVGQIKHPNVCTVHDFVHADGRWLLLMEYVPGETLQELLEREGRLPPVRAVRIAAQIAWGLQAAHDAGVVHRDLKPSNVMVEARGADDVAKVVDFDIAKGSAEEEASDVTRFGFVVGTPEYMAPEQLRSLPLDGSSDVYALALALFEMLTGPFSGHPGDTQHRVHRRLSGIPMRLDDVLPAHGFPPALQQALDRALQARREDRFENAAAFANAILAAVEVPPGVILTRPPSASPSAASPSLRPIQETTPPGADGRSTRGGAPPTVVSAERDRAPSGVGPIARRRITRTLGTVLLAAFAFAGAWAAGRALGLSPRVNPAGEVHTHAKHDTTASSTAPTDTSGTAPAPPDSTAPAPEPSKDRIDERPPREESVPTQVPENRDEPREEDVPPVVEDVASVLDALEDRVGPPYPSSAELRRVRDGAQAVWNRGARVGAQERARAAFVLAHAELGLDDPVGCVRWAERAASLRPGGARQVLLDECRRVAG